MYEWFGGSVGCGGSKNIIMPPKWYTGALCNIIHCIYIYRICLIQHKYIVQMNIYIYIYMHILFSDGCRSFCIVKSHHFNTSET